MICQGPALRQNCPTMKRPVVPLAWLTLTVLLAVSTPAGAASADSDLLAYLPLTQDLLDHSAHRRPVAVTGQVAVVDGVAHFSGGKSWLDLPHIPLNQGPFTISMWVKVTGTEPMYGLVEQRDSKVPNHHFHIMLRGDLQPWLGFYMNDVVSPSSLTPGAWTHLAFQYNGTHQLIWVNGRLLCQRRASAYAGAGGVTTLGKNPNWNNVPARHFEGQMREVRIYGRALAYEDIATHSLPAGGGRPITVSASASATVTVMRATASLEPAGAAKPASNPAPFLAIDGRRLTITGAAGQVYTLQATANILGPWEPLATLTNTAGTLHFIDTDAASANERFYRIVVK